MASRAGVVGDGAIGSAETLGRTGRWASLHAMLALMRRPMGGRTPIIERATLAVFHPRQPLPLGRAVARELIRDDHPWPVRQSPAYRAAKLRRRLFIVPALHQDIAYGIVLVDSPPQGMTLAVD